MFGPGRGKWKWAEQELLNNGQIANGPDRGREGKKVSKRVIQKAMGKGWEGRGRGIAAGRDKLRKGACLPLSCVSWPAVKSRSLPVSTGSPQGAIVQDCEGETGTERATDRGLNNLVELLLNLRFWRLVDIQITHTRVRLTLPRPPSLLLPICIGQHHSQLLDTNKADLCLLDCFSVQITTTDLSSPQAWQSLRVEPWPKASSSSQSPSAYIYQ